MRNKLGVNRLHANELGAGRLISVAKEFTIFQKEHDVRFNFYKINKNDHAIITFFDQIFDSGMNEAVAWQHYWTPMRYVFLFKLAYLFDTELKKMAWTTRLMINRDECAVSLSKLCKQLRAKVSILPDERSRDIINAGLLWAEHNADKIQYGIVDKNMALQISPNLIGFQLVLQGIGLSAQKANKPIRAIIVDQQSEFNKAQKFANNLYQKFKEAATIEMLPGMPDINMKLMPDIDLDFKAGNESAGLEMVDIYLWLMKRNAEKLPLPPELQNLLNMQRRGKRDEVSLAELDKKYSWLLHLPDPTAEELNFSNELKKKGNEKRLMAIKGLH